MALPLSNIVVLEFTHAVMGPAAGVILADMGAEVIHIEPIDGDPTRKLKGFGAGYHSFFNRNKKSLAIDLKSEQGKDIIFRLLGHADVLVENFGPGTLDRLGFGYEALAPQFPRLIHCSLKGFLPGPYEKRHAMDEVVQMMGGLAYMTGRSGDPLRAGTSIVDISGGMFGVIGILAALLEREHSGKGGLVQASLFETTAFLMGQHMANSAITQQPLPPMPERVSAWSIYRIFQTRDHQQLFIGIISDKHWQRFCEVFEKPDWAADERLRTNNDRIAQRDWFIPAFEELIRSLDKEVVIARCEGAGIPFAPISRPEDLFHDIQLIEGGSLLDTHLPDGGITRLPKLPLRYQNEDFGLRRQPPKIGEDTRALLSRVGIPDDTIEAMQEQHIISG